MKNSNALRDALNELRTLCYERSKAGGWHEENDIIRQYMAQNPDSPVTGIFKNQMINGVPVVTKLGLIATEVAEAVELVRNVPVGDPMETQDVQENGGKPEGLPSELADILIRTFDLAGALGIDIGDAVVRKLNANTRRPWRHGGKRF